MNYLQLLIARFKSETPRFFKVLVLIFAIIAGALFFLLGANNVSPFLSEHWVKVLSYVMTTSAAIAATAQTTTSDTKLQNIK